MTDASSDGAERSLRRADLVDELQALDDYKRRRFWGTAKWIVPGALFSAIGVRLGVWDAVLTVFVAAVLGAATWSFIGANARVGQITTELARLGGADEEVGGDAGRGTIAGDTAPNRQDLG